MVSIIVALFAVAGCRHGNNATRPRATVDKELLNLSKEQIFQKGEDAFNAKKYARARKFYSYVYENYPNDPLGRRSLLRVRSPLDGLRKDRNRPEKKQDEHDGSHGSCPLQRIGKQPRDLLNSIPGIEILDTQFPNPPTMDKARDVTQDMLTRNSGVDGIFACNATPAGGAPEED